MNRPNILIILTDDMGFSDIGCYGGEISTPNVDRLAGKGVRFSRFYNNAVCNPTRASLLTGLYAHQVGAEVDTKLNETGNVTIAEALKSAGYRTLMSGKWHNGDTPGMLPTDRGFDRYWGLLSGCSNYFNPGLKRLWEPEPAHKFEGNTRPWGIDGEVIHPYTPEDPDFYATDVFTDKALEFLDACGREEQPFFLYLSYTAPHFPIHARPEDIEKYRGRFLAGWDELRTRRLERLVEMGLIEREWGLSPRDPAAPAWSDAPDKEDWDLKMAVYAAMIDRVDQGIGRVIERIDSLGKLDDTLIFFLSDNGGCGQHIDRTPDVPPGPVNSYKTVDAPWANLSNTPFRRFKAFDHEGGIATPLVVCWPRAIPDGGGVTHEVGHLIDLMPTCLEVSGARYQAEWNGHPVLPMEGRSLVPAFRGETREREEPLCWEFTGCRAALVGRWKIVSQGLPRSQSGVQVGPGCEDWELYDMVEDRCELSDLSGKYPDKVRELESAWLEWRARCG